MFLNKLQIIGRLTSDPEKKFTPNGKEYASFAMAVNHYHADKEGKVIEEVDYFHVHAYGHQGAKALKLGQGSLAYVEGQFRSHKSEDGRYFWTLKAEAVRRLEKLDKPEPGEAEPSDEHGAD